MSVKKKIYLSGPIMDEHPELAATWRERAKEGLRDHFTLLDPMRRNFKPFKTAARNCSSCVNFLQTPLPSCNKPCKML